MFETMASFMLVEHANGAMFDPGGARDLPEGRVAGPAPQLGADTAEVLDELGIGADAAQGSA